MHRQALGSEEQDGETGRGGQARPGSVSLVQVPNLS